MHNSDSYTSQGQYMNQGQSVRFGIGEPRTHREYLEALPFTVSTNEGGQGFATQAEAEKIATEAARRGATVGVWKLVAIVQNPVEVIPIVGKQ